MSDPRKGLVSASRFEIFALCPGSEQLRKTLPPEALESSDEYSEMGTRLHKAFETDFTFELSEPELEIYKNGVKTERQIIRDWCDTFGITDYQESEREERLFIHDPKTLKPIASGQLDRKYIAGSHALVIDFKALWCSNLTPAESNYQGRLQAVLMAWEYGVTHVRMAFNKAMFGRSDHCDYDQDALQRAQWSIYYHDWESKQPGAPRRPGEWCTHCPCKAYCPEASAYAVLPVKRAETIQDTLALVASVPIEDAVVIWRKRGEVDKIFKAFEARLKALPESELDRLNLRMAEGRRADFVKDVYAAFVAMKEAGFDEAQIFTALSFNKERLLKVIQNQLGCRERMAENYYENQFDEFIERARQKPSLVIK